MHKHSRTIGSALLCLSLLSPAGVICNAQQGDARHVEMSFGQEITLQAFVDTVVGVLGKNVYYGSEDLKEKVRIRISGSLPYDSLMPILVEILDSKGYTVLDEGNWVRIMRKKAGLSTVPSRIAEGPLEDSPAGWEPITYVARLKSLDIATAKSLVSSLITAEGGTVIEVPQANALIICDNGINVRRIEKILATLDREKALAVLEEIRLDNISPTEMAAILGSLMVPERGAGTSPVVFKPLDKRGIIVAVGARDAVEKARGLIGRLDRPGPAAVAKVYHLRGIAASTATDVLKKAFAAGAGLSVKRTTWFLNPEVFPVEGDDSIVVVATPEQHEAVGEFLRTLETPVGGETAFRVYRLHNTDAKACLPLLQSLLVKGAEGVSMESGILSLSEVPGSDAVAASGSSEALDRLESVVAMIDAKRPQVMIDALFFNLSAQKQLGELFEAGKTGSDSFGYTSFGLRTLDIKGNIADITFVPQGLTAGIIRGNAIPAVLNAISRDSTGEILARPIMLVNDNESASFENVDEKPYAATTALNTASTTTTFGDFAQAGVSLKVTPHISDTGHVRLKINMEVSEFSGPPPVTGAPPPRIRNQIDTIVTVPGDATILIGGLMSNIKREATTGVPLLKDIPGLGRLFRKKDDTYEKRSLYVLIRPSILVESGFEDLSEESEAKKNLIVENVREDASAEQDEEGDGDEPE